MDPNEFVETISKNGQVPSFVGEVARRKALSIVLSEAIVTDKSKNPVDLGEFLKGDNSSQDSHAGHDHD
jgi:trigger factor